MGGLVGSLHEAVLVTVTMGKVYFLEVIVRVEVVVFVIVTLWGVIVTVLLAVAEASVTVIAGSVLESVSVMVVGRVIDGVTTFVIFTNECQIPIICYRITWNDLPVGMYVTVA